MTSLTVKRGDTLTLAGELTMPAPDGGWTGYSLKADVMAIGASGYPAGDVLGSFVFTGPDASTGAFAMTCLMDMAAPVVGFDVALVSPDDAVVTTHGFGQVALHDRITATTP